VVSRRWVVNPRNARYAGVLFIFGTVEFLIGMAVAQIGYGPSYSISQNLLSDLGVTRCGLVDSTGRYACSPWFVAFDAAVVLLGCLTIFGAIWVRRAFPAGPLSVAGLGLLALNGLGLLGAGLSPENVNDAAHTDFALLAFACGSVALIVLGVAMRASPLWKGVPAYSVASGLISGFSLLLFVGGSYLGLGLGGMERLVVAPVLLWLVVVGVRVVRIPPAALAVGSLAAAS
jgi:hypothetical membrane protein